MMMIVVMMMIMISMMMMMRIMMSMMMMMMIHFGDVSASAIDSIILSICVDTPPVSVYLSEQ